MNNRDVRRILDEVADLLELRGDNAFRIRHYRRASRALRKLDQPVEELVTAGGLRDTLGIGAGLAQSIREILSTGDLTLRTELRAEVPAEMREIFAIPGVGASTARRIVDELRVRSIDQLIQAAEEGRLEDLDGIGIAKAEQILQGARSIAEHAGTIPVAIAWAAANSALARVRAHVQTAWTGPTGELRRGLERIRRVEVLVAVQGTSAAASTLDAFAQRTGQHWCVPGDELRPPVDVHVCADSDLGNALIRTTGPGAFVDALSLPETAHRSERSVFEALGRPPIPPELRDHPERFEGLGPDDIVTWSSIRSDLHMHTTASDGHATIAQMAEAASLAGMEFICITDHSPSLTIANGLSVDRLRAQLDEIDAYNADNPSIPVLKGMEVDILSDGALDLDPELLARLDWVVGSVHQHMRMKRDRMTDRLVRAIRSGWISALGHPTGRLIGRREPFDFDRNAVFSACAADARRPRGQRLAQPARPIRRRSSPRASLSGDPVYPELRRALRRRACAAGSCGAQCASRRSDQRNACSTRCR